MVNLQAVTNEINVNNGRGSINTKNQTMQNLLSSS